MNNTKKLILQILEDEFSVTTCVNGYLLDLAGKDEKNDYHRVKYLVNSLDDLFDLIRQIDERFEAKGKAN
jgi:hypothetical protein